MKWWLILLFATLVACDASLPADDPGAAQNLLEARSDHQTRLTETRRESEVPAEPPAEFFVEVQYATDLGPMKAWLSPPPGGSEGPTRHPAIIWLVGGFPPAGFGSFLFEPAEPDDDQSAAAYRRAGVISMFPSLRGSAGNPGRQESFYGEVDDVLAALRYLQQQPHVDADRVYLGGHSTGATLALLVAAATDQFAGVFAFGPVSEPGYYGEDILTFDPFDDREYNLRSPIHHLDAIRSPTWIIEGEGGNSDQLPLLDRRTENPQLRFVLVPGADHFDVLAPLNHLIANRIGESSESDLALTAEELRDAYRNR